MTSFALNQTVQFTSTTGDVTRTLRGVVTRVK